MKPLPPDNTTTESEAYLARLCRRTFLRLWSYPGLYRDQRQGSTGDGKELCDLLVLFENDVLLFSDKDCRFQEDKPIEIAWSRWYRNAVLEAAKQLDGAERWLATNPSRVYLDRACTLPFPLALPSEPRFHRIVTCRGAAKSSLQILGGTGTLFATNFRLEECCDRPMYLGAKSERNEIIHVLDEVALDTLFRTFDTVSDLCAYLTERERFFRLFEAVVAAGEDELVAYYLLHYSQQERRHVFQVQGKDETDRPTMVAIDEGFWSEWQLSQERRAKVEADEVSYAWDRLIEKFTFHLLTETQEFASHTAVADNEIMLRWMAREPRVRRRMLARSLLEAMSKTPVGQMRRQLILPSHDGDPHWVFLVFPRPPDMTLARYRGVRRDLLVALCKVAKFVRPEAIDIAGIAVGASESEISEDLMYLDARVWNEELQTSARQIFEKTGFFKNEAKVLGTEYEIPRPRTF